jgi:hypothetical protein
MGAKTPAKINKGAQQYRSVAIGSLVRRKPAKLPLADVTTITSGTMKAHTLIRQQGPGRALAYRCKLIAGLICASFASTGHLTI